MNRLNRDQMRLKTLKENPGLSQSAPLFAEAFVFNASVQEGIDILRLAQFTGLSKGRVKQLLDGMEAKLRIERRTLINEERRKEMEAYDPTKEASNVNDDAAGSGDVQPLAQGVAVESVLPGDVPSEG
jgi:hypothetical protein